MRQHIVMVYAVTGATVSYSHGLASLAAVLIGARDRAFDLVLVTLRDHDITICAEEILSWNPAIVLASAMSNQWERMRSVAALVKKHAPSLPICVGGTHVIAAPATVADSPFDIGFPTEAEDAIERIVYGGPLRATDVRARAHLLAATSRPRSELDSLPRPYLGIFPRNDVLEYPSVMFSRGCPYRCTYCMSREGGLGGKVRWKSPERAMGEVIDLVEYAQPSEIHIDDDTLLKNPRWVKEFCRLYRESVEIPFFCNARPETVTLDLARCLREAHCRALGIGIESGSPRIRRDVLQRPMSDDVIVRAFEYAHAAGLQTWSFNMVGMPGERPEDLLATIRLNERVQTDFLRVSIFTPYPGSPIFDHGATPQYHNSYFRSAGDLPEELRTIYCEWIGRLDREGRLWFTESEATSRASGFRTECPDTSEDAAP